jgi:hypothetical protein
MEEATETPRDKFRYLVTCPCGLTRCLPQDINVGDAFSLVPCIRCGATMIGTFIGDKVEVR